MTPARRLLLRAGEGVYDLVDLASIFYLRARGGDAEVRARRRLYRTSERLSQLERRLPSPPFLRVHRALIVNLDRVRRLQRRPEGDWELLLDPPVSERLPVARTREKRLFTALGEAGRSGAGRRR